MPLECDKSLSSQEHPSRSWRSGEVGKVFNSLQSGHRLYQAAGGSTGWGGKSETKRAFDIEMMKVGKLREGLASSAPRLTGHELNRRRDLLDSLQRKERSLRDVVS